MDPPQHIIALLGLWPSRGSAMAHIEAMRIHIGSHAGLQDTYHVSRLEPISLLLPFYLN